MTDGHNHGGNMKVEKKGLHDSLQDQIKILADRNGKDIIGRLKNANLYQNDSDISYDPHTILKLAYLNYYLGIFLRIAGKGKKDGRFDKLIFIDAFGGGGLVGIANTNHSILGSTLLAATAIASGNTFDQVITVEMDEKRSKLISKRCETLKLENVKAINDDINNVVQILPNLCNITPKTIIMLFIDPEGMEPEFSKFIPLTQATSYIDIMLNYTFGVRRLDGRIFYNQSSADIERMKKMIPNYTIGSDPEERLAEYFENEFGKPKVRQVKIHSKGNIEKYSMVLRVRRTINNSEWLKAMNSFGDFISSIDGLYALKTLEIVMGGQTTLF